jgi:hypothetical protein
MTELIEERGHTSGRATMPRIFDNIEQEFLPALQQTLEIADHAARGCARSQINQGECEPRVITA